MFRTLPCLFFLSIWLVVYGNSEDFQGSVGTIQDDQVNSIVTTEDFQHRRKSSCGKCRAKGTYCQTSCHFECRLKKELCPTYQPVVDSILDSIEGTWYIQYSTSSIPHCSDFTFTRKSHTKTTCTVIQRGKDKLEVSSEGRVSPSEPSRLVVRTLKEGSKNSYNYVTMQFRTDIHNGCALLSMCYQGRDDLLAISTTKFVSERDFQWINESYKQVDSAAQKNRVIQNCDG